MIDLIEQYRTEDIQRLSQLFSKPITQRLMEDYYKQNEKAIEFYQEQNRLYVKIEGMQECGVQPKELIELQMRNEELERQNRDLYTEVQETSKQLRHLKEQSELQQQCIKNLEGEKVESQNKILKLEDILEQKNKDIREIVESRDKLLVEIEQLTIVRSQLEEMMLREKMKILEQLNEINELNESVQRQKRVLEQDQDRFNKQYKDIQTQGKFQTLAPLATEQQLAKNAFLDDIPQMVVRRLNKFHNVEIYAIAQNLNGTLIATCGGDRIIRLYDPFNLTQVSQYQTSSDEVFTSVEFSPSQDCILVSSTDNSCQLFYLQQWKQKMRGSGHVDQVTCSTFLGGDKDSCVSGSKDRQIKLWNINNSFCTRTLSTGSQVLSIISEHNVPVIISGHRDGSIRGYSLKSDPKPIFQEKSFFDDSVTSLCISQDNHTLLCCSKEGYYIKSYDLRMNKLLKTYEHDKYMNSHDHNMITFGPDEKYIIAGNSDSSLISWNINGRFHKQLTKGQHEGVVLSVSFHPVSGQMYSADTRGNLVIWK
ncbi:unnamed protein product [Paramecium octaurelia]|uniref:Uncharacterized protein n=1 Tax=Paramecium octaurelia TaxID=43137 RepID=A0A8S1UA39_PAROT|nr:unnamed protein product [Paramecium octaurelia]